jgi:hypothetical protein
MILLSFRKNFDNRLEFAAVPQWRIPPGETTAGRRCLFMIHGYENSAGAAEGNYANIERNLRDCGLFDPDLEAGKRFNQLVGVLWPGQTALGFWLAERAADRAAILLRQAIESMPPAESISIVTHSLGARVALAGFLPSVSGRLYFRRFQETVLLAPAVDDNCLDRGGRYALAALFSQRTLVCYSRRDEVLGIWFRRFSAFLNFNDVALGYNGPRNPSKVGPGVAAFDGTPYVDSHGGWMSCKQMYALWACAVWPSCSSPAR